MTILHSLAELGGAMPPPGRDLSHLTVLEDLDMLMRAATAEDVALNRKVDAIDRPCVEPAWSEDVSPRYRPIANADAPTCKRFAIGGGLAECEKVLARVKRDAQRREEQRARAAMLKRNLG